MYKKIYKAIKKFDTIVIARHVGVDPDAMASQIGLRDAILLTFPKKKVLAIGNGSNKFTYLGKLDRLYDIDYQNSLLIVLDTPDKRRVDSPEVDAFGYKIKIDHHLFVEKFCDIELVNEKSSSACQLIIELLYKTKFKKDTSIMGKLFLGLISDTNRFLFNTSKETFHLMQKVLEDYPLDLPSLYANLYRRPLSEVRLEGYISQNMIVTENGVGYIKLTNDVINKFGADTASAGNMVNDFNYIEEVLV